MPSVDTVFKPIQLLVDLAKSALLLVVIAYAAFQGRGAFHSLVASLEAGKTVPSEVTVNKDGFTLKLEQAKDTISAAVNAQTIADGKQDKPVSAGLKPLLGALEKTETALAAAKKTSPPGDAIAAVAPAQSRGVWIYLGIEKSGRWNPDYFGLKGSPSKEQVLMANTEVYKRATKPTYFAATDDWKLGNVVGVLRPNQKVKVTDLESIPSDNGGLNWWACVWPLDQGP